ETGKSLLGFKIDPYVNSLSIARVHLLLPANETLTRETLQAALQARHFYTGFDIIGDTTGFTFGVDGGGAVMGDEIAFAEGVTLKAETPVPARIVFYKNGQVAGTPNNGRLTVDGPGVYRVEVYLDELGEPFDKMPWILSNPIY